MFKKISWTEIVVVYKITSILDLVIISLVYKIFKFHYLFILSWFDFWLSIRYKDIFSTCFFFDISISNDRNRISLNDLVQLILQACLNKREISIEKENEYYDLEIVSGHHFVFDLNGWIYLHCHCDRFSGVNPSGKGLSEDVWLYFCTRNKPLFLSKSEFK